MVWEKGDMLRGGLNNHKRQGEQRRVREGGRRGDFKRGGDRGREEGIYNNWERVKAKRGPVEGKRKEERGAL